mgnify:CR=1 FL=1
MVVNNPKFEISAVKPAQYPKNNLPEVVLVGKSNVGKSSFINTMINRKKLARTSSEPGKTRQINFYNIDEKFYFVLAQTSEQRAVEFPCVLDFVFVKLRRYHEFLAHRS